MGDAFVTGHSSDLVLCGQLANGDEVVVAWASDAHQVLEDD